MTPTRPPANVIDLTGLPEKDVEAVRVFVEGLREQVAMPSVPVGFSSREEWVKAIREWAASHEPQGAAADWSRESIYAERGG